MAKRAIHAMSMAMMMMFSRIMMSIDDDEIPMMLMS